MEWKNEGIGYLMNDLKKECIDYFKSKKGFNRLFKEVWEKLKILGKVGGYVILKGITKDEKECIEGFMRKSFNEEVISISIKDIAEAFLKTKFGKIDFIEFMEGYFQNKLVTNKRVREKFKDEREEFFNSIRDNYINTPSYGWLTEVFMQKKFGYQTISRNYSESEIDNSILKKAICYVADGINALNHRQNKFIRLGVFATEITKDPHFFDKGTLAGGLFLQGLSFIFNSSFPSNAEEISEIYYLAGIVTDKISSYAVAKGVRLFNEKEHPAFKEFNDLNEDFIITLSNLEYIKSAKAVNNKVFVVENPNAFSAICDMLKGEDFSLICTNGQLRLASQILLDMLYESGCEIFYSGDFDGGGLLIADRLKNKYKDKLIFWRYGVNDYLENISEVLINEIGLKKIQSIKREELSEVISKMKLLKRAAYQEMMVDNLSFDIMNFKNK